MKPAKVDFSAAQQLIAIAGQHLSGEARSIRKLLDESDRHLSPLGDPLRVDMGLNRWLFRAREESYSDWLAWILGQMSRPGDVCAVLGIRPKAMPSGSVDLRREVVLKDGRLDLRIELPGHILIAVEVKKRSASGREKLKQAGYKRALSGGQYRRWRRYYIYLADETEGELQHGFTTRNWENVCLEVRDWAARLLKTRKADPSMAVTVALALGFAGAVEQNLLGFEAWTLQDSLVSKPLAIAPRLRNYVDQVVQHEKK